MEKELIELCKAFNIEGEFDSIEVINNGHINSTFLVRFFENGKIKAPSSVFLYRLSNALELDYNEMLNYKYASYYRLKELLNA